jgi:hypothetical protein
MSCSLEPRASSRWHAIPCPPDPLLATDLLVARGQAYLVALRVTDGATVAARYDPADGSWHEGPALAAGDLPAASLVLRDGRLLVLDRGLYGVYDPDQEGYPSEGGTFASPAVTEWESGIAVLLLALLALRWWRSAAQRTSGRGREIG